MTTDVRDRQAADALVAQVPQYAAAPEGWVCDVERELGGGELQVLRVSHPRCCGYYTVEASGHRAAGGFEYFLTVFEPGGDIRKGPLRFTYPGGALHWGRYYLCG